MVNLNLLHAGTLSDKKLAPLQSIVNLLIVNCYRCGAESDSVELEGIEPSSLLCESSALPLCYSPLSNLKFKI